MSGTEKNGSKTEDAMKLLYFSQRGMEIALRRFTEYLGGLDGTISHSVGISFVSCDFEERSALFAFRVTDWAQDPRGGMHGGAVSAAIDMAMGSCTCCWAGCRSTPTVSMQLNFLRPIPLDAGHLMIRVQLHACGRTTAYTSAYGYLEGQEDRRVVVADGVYTIYPGEEGIMTGVLAQVMEELSGTAATV